MTSDGLVTGLASGHASVVASSESRSTSILMQVRWIVNAHARGDTLVLEGGNIVLRLPPGALSVDTVIEADSALGTADSRVLSGTTFSLSPLDLRLVRQSSLVLQYALAATSPGLVRSIGMYVLSGGGWLAVQGSRLDAGLRAVTAPVSALGVYALLAPGPVDTLSVGPSGVLLVYGTTFQLNVELRDSVGTVLTNRPIAWTSSNPTVATVNQSGLVTTTGLGVDTVYAQSGGATGYAVVNVSFSCNCSRSPSAPRTSLSACACGPGGP